MEELLLREIRELKETIKMQNERIEKQDKQMKYQDEKIRHCEHILSDVNLIEVRKAAKMIIESRRN